VLQGNFRERSQQPIAETPAPVIRTRHTTRFYQSIEREIQADTVNTLGELVPDDTDYDAPNPKET
jgi:hypothetical protein